MCGGSRLGDRSEGRERKDKEAGEVRRGQGTNGLLDDANEVGLLPAAARTVGSCGAFSIKESVDGTRASGRQGQHLRQEQTRPGRAQGREVG